MGQGAAAAVDCVGLFAHVFGFLVLWFFGRWVVLVLVVVWK